MHRILNSLIEAVIAALIVHGLGYTYGLHADAGNDMGDVVRGILLAALTWAFYKYSSRRKWSLMVACGLGLISSLYMISGAGVSYGEPNISLVASVLETDLSESAEFMTSINLSDIILCLVTQISLLMYWLKYRGNPGKVGG